MNEWIWIDGEIIPMTEARISVEDRGFQFADGVYEVIKLYKGKPFALAPHLARLQQSAAGIDVAMPADLATVSAAVMRIVDKNQTPEGMVYIQLTRGAAPRNHIFSPQTRPTLLMYSRPLPPPQKPGEGEGARLISLEDDRWKRCWIKSIALLPNVLAKNTAHQAGADEAVFIDHGIVTECSATNIFAVIDGKLVTHPVGSKVLPGITRAILLDCATSLDITVDERGFTEVEALGAAELFITSTTREVSWVAQWNDRQIGHARCGPMTVALHRALCARVRQETT